ncbi:MAG: sensor histidine kinase [Pseudorhodoplanes sp.]
MPLPIGRFFFSEDPFLKVFRYGGVRNFKIALAIALGTYLMLGIYDLFEGGVNTRFRVFPVACLIAGIAILNVGARLVERYYVLFITGILLVAYAGVILGTSVLRAHSEESPVSPTTIFAIVIVYSFSRLPAAVAVAIGMTMTVGALFVGASVTNLPDSQIRTGVYLLLANGLGFAQLRSTESRERLLFNQRNKAETLSRELEQRTNAAHDAYSTKSRLLAAVGHDLRQPLAAARISTEVAELNLAKARYARAAAELSGARSALNELDSILENLFESASLELKHEPYRLGSASLMNVLSRIDQQYSARGANQGTQVHIRKPCRDRLLVTDESALVRVLLNLIDNAIKFSDDTRPQAVIVRSSVTADGCRIAVIDRGRGMHPESLERVWLPYYRDSNEEHPRQGIGLGLYLVRLTIDKLDRHSIRVSSTAGRGTRFVVHVPVSSSVGTSKPLPISPIERSNA